jgi:RNA 2',3'-cyclic 3'-phosphodiesterase
MARLFVAFEIGAAAQARVSEEQERLADTMRGASLRWVKREQLHLTLVFIGDVPDERATPIVEAMRVPLAHPPFTFALGGIGAFPPRGAPRALWMGIKTGADEIVRVQAAVAERLEALGVEGERRPFSPHLTLARWRDSRPSDRPRTSHGEPVTIAMVNANVATLIQSRVSSAGSTYTRLVECPLRVSRSAD